MGLFGRNGKEPGTELVRQGPVKSVDPKEEPIPESEFIWRCGACGSMGASRESLHAHIGKFRRGRMCEIEDIKTYVPAVEQEYEAKAAELSASGIWIVVKLDEKTPEGEMAPSGYGYYRPNEMTATVVEAKTGLEAIQIDYKQKIESLREDAKIKDRDRFNGRYVAIDFFTGYRAEALVTSDWRANVEVAEGSHQ